jgi:DNA repair protein RecO (recombination protein O)
MSDLITVQGVVLSAMPVGDYDKRIVLLTREKGKISAFAKGARRPNSPFMAAANPFVFGSFTLFEGRSSYNLNQVSISHHFVELAGEQPGIYYGYYFLELADYFGKEETDEKEMMNLLYVTIKALLNPNIDDRLIRCIYELRTMTIQGLMPDVFQCVCCGREIGEEEEIFFSQEGHGVLCAKCLRETGGVRNLSRITSSSQLFNRALDARRLSKAALYAMQYIVSAPMGRLYTFAVTEEVLREIEYPVHTYIAANTDKRFKSLAILEIMC